MAYPNGTSQANDTKEGFTGYITVEPPASHEGVGRALRAAYYPRANDLPEDIAVLLDRLNQL